MKKHLVLVVFVIAAFLVGSMSVYGNSSKDFKVIKDAVKGKKGGDIQFFMLKVTDKKTKKDTVKIKIPFFLVEMMEQTIEKETAKVKDCDVDFKKMMKALKDNGPTTLVEIDTEEALIKIWFE